MCSTIASATCWLHVASGAALVSRETSDAAETGESGSVVAQGCRDGADFKLSDPAIHCTDMMRFAVRLLPTGTHGHQASAAPHALMCLLCTGRQPGPLWHAEVL